MNVYNIDNKNNRIMGASPNVIDSKIEFKGKNNILYCEENVVIKDSNIKFNGDNSLIFLGCGEHKLDIDIFNSSVCHCGQHVWYTKTLRIILSEHKHCFIGDSCLVSLGVVIRNADPHLIYDCRTKNRINLSRSVFIGDHVWIGQYINILKGTYVDSGSILGASSVLAGKIIPHNSVWAGNPAIQIKNDIFWDGKCVHEFDEETTEISKNYEDYINKYKESCHVDYWIFDYNKEQEIPWEYLDDQLSQGSSEDKCNFLIKINVNKEKNRFVHNIDKESNH